MRKQHTILGLGGFDLNGSITLDPWLAARLPGTPTSLHLHHAGHAAAAFWTSEFDNALAIPLHGRGDGLSGAPVLMNRSGRIEPVLTVPSASSIGRLWWATSAAGRLEVASRAPPRTAS